MIGLLAVYVYIGVGLAAGLVLCWRRDRPSSWREFWLDGPRKEER
jgi:hypothetical protein